MEDFKNTEDISNNNSKTNLSEKKEAILIHINGESINIEIVSYYDSFDTAKLNNNQELLIDLIDVKFNKNDENNEKYINNVHTFSKLIDDLKIISETKLIDNLNINDNLECSWNIFGNSTSSLGFNFNKITLYSEYIGAHDRAYFIKFGFIDCRLKNFIAMFDV